MRSLLMGAAMAVAMAGAAAAQTPPAQGGSGGPSGQGQAPAIVLVPAANGGDAGVGPEGGAPPPHQGPGMGPHSGWEASGGGPMGDRMERMMMWHAMHAKEGASFKLERGDNKIEVRCPANQPMKDCVAAAGTLLDKVASMHAGNASSPAKP